MSSSYFPPSHNHHHKTRTLDFEMLYDVKSLRFFFTCALWLRTRLSHVYNLIWRRDCDNRFSTWLFYILVCLFLFVFFTSYCRSYYEGALKKIAQMWSDYHFLILSKMTVQINAKEFSVNSRETPRFSRTILHGSLAGSREYKQYRNQKQRQHKGHETRTR